MKFIPPLGINKQAVDWRISKHSRDIVKYYAEYTERHEEDVVDMVVKNLLTDPGFLNWIKTRRYNKRICQQLQLDLPEIAETDDSTN